MNYGLEFSGNPTFALKEKTNMYFVPFVDPIDFQISIRMNITRKNERLSPRLGRGDLLAGYQC